jgi:hypothetical protein
MRRSRKMHVILRPPIRIRLDSYTIRTPAKSWSMFASRRVCLIPKGTNAAKADGKSD